MVFDLSVARVGGFVASENPDLERWDTSARLRFTIIVQREQCEHLLIQHLQHLYAAGLIGILELQTNLCEDGSFTITEKIPTSDYVLLLEAATTILPPSHLRI